MPDVAAPETPRPRSDFNPSEIPCREINRLHFPQQGPVYWQSSCRVLLLTLDSNLTHGKCPTIIDTEGPDHWEVNILLEHFDANGALRLLAENPANLSLDVSWDFTPLGAALK